MLNTWLLVARRGGNVWKPLICSICQCPRYKRPYHALFEATNELSTGLQSAWKCDSLLFSHEWVWHAHQWPERAARWLSCLWALAQPSPGPTCRLPGTCAVQPPTLPRRTQEGPGSDLSPPLFSLGDLIPCLFSRHPGFLFCAHTALWFPAKNCLGHLIYR